MAFSPGLSLNDKKLAARQLGRLGEDLLAVHLRAQGAMQLPIQTATLQAPAAPSLQIDVFAAEEDDVRMVNASAFAAWSERYCATKVVSEVGTSQLLCKISSTFFIVSRLLLHCVVLLGLTTQAHAKLGVVD